MHTVVICPYENWACIVHSTKFWRGKTLANQSFQSFGRGNVGEFTISNIATLVNLEFGGVKYWRMVFSLPNSPKFPPPKFCAIRYMHMFSLKYMPDSTAA